jgi:hypothetical protein
MKNLWSIYLIPESLRGLVPLSTEWKNNLDLLPESEIKDRILRWPHAAQHDGLNYVFVTTHPAAFEPIDLSVAEYETVDQLIAIIANALFAEDRSKAIHLTKAQTLTLYAHPAWRLWCGRYDNDEALEVDHELVFGTGVDRRKSLDTLIAEARAELKAFFAPSV